ncbi:hypothetical protein AAF712_011237 [Marasmius tenuissimus]|uniref:Uncharacterized protein n=1 Tax=Marasmius tenuissimus TaxID=585030 RepID=A0ABR2ZMK7_9AGAR|nr:hypothetical protein PM082_001345 [Marasmius tenuissimus]
MIVTDNITDDTDTRTPVEPREDDLQITRSPIEQSYHELVHATGGLLDVYYWQQDPTPKALEDLSGKVYAVWVEVWPDPLDVELVKEEAGGDKEKAAIILQRNLIQDAAKATAKFRRNVEERIELDNFTRAEAVRQGYATWDRAMDGISLYHGWSRWANPAYMEALATLKKAFKAKNDAELDCWRGPMFDVKEGPEKYIEKVLECYGKTTVFYDKALDHFLGNIYPW